MQIRRDYLRARKVIERLLVLSPDSPEETRNLGLLYGATGQFSAGDRAIGASTCIAYQMLPMHTKSREYVVALTRSMARWN